MHVLHVKGRGPVHAHLQCVCACTLWLLICRGVTTGTEQYTKVLLAGVGAVGAAVQTVRGSTTQQLNCSTQEDS